MVMKLAVKSEPDAFIVPAGEFKAKCLKLMDESKAKQHKVGITKRGVLVGHFVPVALEEKPFYSIVGRSPNIKIHGDIISPLPEEWTLPGPLFPQSAKQAKKAKKKK
jgi:hypothetical protein